MRILSSTVEHARYARDFGQVEALINLLVKDDRRPVPYTVRLRTAELAHGTTPLRDRLIASASALLLARQALTGSPPPCVSHAA